jgi:membrane protease YdiL (CAAX protease family)
MDPSPDAKYTLRLSIAVAVWAAAYHSLSTFGVAIFPRALLRELTLEAYMALVQLLTLGVGVGAVFALVQNPETALPLRTASRRSLLITATLAPFVFAVCTTVAFLVAKPTLIAEILEGGRELAQRNTGRFGRELVESPAILALAWGAVISPLGEESFFRGALWSLVQSVVARFAGTMQAEPSDALPSELIEPSLIESGLAMSGRWFVAGGLTTILVGLLFGFLHRDVPGGLGIVRFVSALGLGFACGLARQNSGSVVPAVLLHVLYNALSLASVRRWVVTETFPVKNGAPTLVTIVGVVGVVVAVLLVKRRRT